MMIARDELRRQQQKKNTLVLQLSPATTQPPKEDPKPSLSPNAVSSLQNMNTGISREERESAIESSLSNLTKNAQKEHTEDKLLAGLQTLTKLLQNIKDKPTELKFRVLNRENKAIQSKLLQLEPKDSLEMLLASLGYECEENEP